jgi:hypothetical protein
LNIGLRSAIGVFEKRLSTLSSESNQHFIDYLFGRIKPQELRPLENSSLT